MARRWSRVGWLEACLAALAPSDFEKPRKLLMTVWPCPPPTPTPAEAEAEAEAA